MFVKIMTKFAVLTGLLSPASLFTMNNLIVNASVGNSLDDTFYSYSTDIYFNNNSEWDWHPDNYAHWHATSFNISFNVQRHEMFPSGDQLSISELVRQKIISAPIFSWVEGAVTMQSNTPDSFRTNSGQIIYPNNTVMGFVDTRDHHTINLGFFDGVAPQQSFAPLWGFINFIADQNGYLSISIDKQLRIGFTDDVADEHAGNININTKFNEQNPQPFQEMIDTTSFYKNELMTIDYDNSYTDETNSNLWLKFNLDYIAADLMSWDAPINEVSGKKDGSGNYDNSLWLQITNLQTYAKMLEQWAFNDISNAILDGKLINLEAPNNICSWAIPNTSIEPLNNYANEDASWSLLNFLINHSHDSQTKMEAYLQDLPIQKWKTDSSLFGIDITSALQYPKYSDMVGELLNQDLSYTLSWETGLGETRTTTFTLKELIAGEIKLSFAHLEGNTDFILQSCITTDGAFGTIGASDSLGIYDTQHKDPDGKQDPKVYTLDGSEGGEFVYFGATFLLSRALDETVGQNEMFFGETGLGDNPTAWTLFEKCLYAQTPSAILGFINDGEVPNEITGLGNIPFDRTSFLKVKDTFIGQYTLDDIVDTLTWAADDVTGTLSAHVTFKDASMGDDPQDLVINLFSKKSNIQVHARTTPLDIEPSQITEQTILDQLIKYTDSKNFTDGDPYLFETNLTKNEFNSVYQGLNLKVQDDADGKLDVLFKLFDVCYQMNPQGMPTPQIQQFDLLDTDFNPLNPPNHKSNYLWMAIVFPLVGVSAVAIGLGVAKKKKKKFNTTYDATDDDDIANAKRKATKQSGVEVKKDEPKAVESSGEGESVKPNKKSGLSKFKKFMGFKEKPKGKTTKEGTGESDDDAAMK